MAVAWECLFIPHRLLGKSASQDESRSPLWPEEEGRKSTPTVPSVNRKLISLELGNPFRSQTTDHIHPSAPSCLPQNRVKTHTAPWLWTTDETRVERRPKEEQTPASQSAFSISGAPLGDPLLLTTAESAHRRDGFIQPVKNRIETPPFKCRIDAG